MLRNTECTSECVTKCCPLPVSSKIALMGTMNGELLVCGEGSANVKTDRNTSFYTELRKRFADVRLDLYDEADTLIYVLNVSGQEGNDRKTLCVDRDEQLRMSKLAAYAAQKKMRSVLILNVSGPVTEWGIGNWNSAYWVSLPGMQGAAALADILCGKVNPSGRLPLTIPYCEDDMPTYLNFPGDGMTVIYGEGIFVGYRYYTTRQYRNGETDFVSAYFGYGLSYSTFAVHDLRVEKGDIASGIDLLAEVEDTGDVAGKTVVQLYLHDPISTLTKPVCELCAFKKVYVEPDQTVTVHMHVERRAFESWDPNIKTWVLEDGVYVLNATVEDAGSIEWGKQFDVVLRYDGESPYSWSENTSIKEIYETSELREALRKFMAKHDLSWENVLTTYQYTAIDSVGKMLRNAGCSDEAYAEFIDTLRQMRHLKR